MKRRSSTVVLTVLALLAGIVPAARAQFPGAPGGEEKPAKADAGIKLVEDLSQRLKNERAALIEEQQALTLQAPEAVASRQRLQELDKRSAALETTRKALVAEETHAAQRLEVDSLIATLAAQRRVLESLLLLRGGERVLLKDSLAVIDKLLEDLAEERRGGEAEVTSIGLKELERIALNAHMAKISLSLARARERQAVSEAEVERVDLIERTALEPLAPMLPLAEAEDASASPTVKSYRVAESLREENVRLRRELDQRRREASKLQSRVHSRRIRFFRLERTAAEREQGARQTELAEALDRVRTTEEEVAAYEERFARSETLRKSSRTRIHREMDQLRSQHSQGTADEDQPFTAAAARDVRLTQLSEQLTLEQFKLERDHFRRDLALNVDQMVAGEPPEGDFTETHKLVLDGDNLAKRMEELEARCDGWRRARNSSSQLHPAPAFEPLQARILESYAGLAETCMREEWVLATLVRLSEIANYHLARVERQQAGFGWWLKRILLTLLFTVLAFLGSWGLLKVTLRLVARRREDQEDLPADRRRGRLARLIATLAMLSFLAGTLLLLLGAAYAIVELAWGVDFEWASLVDWITTPIFLVGESEITAWSLIRVALWTIAAVYVARLASHFLANHFLQYFDMDRGVRDAIGTFTRLTVIASGLALGLSSVGIGLGGLAVLLGVIGIGIGFGLQSLVRNFISGFIILVERPIRKGDFVEAGGLSGVVTDISARSTTIETRDALAVILPNSEFTGSRVVNWTHRTSDAVRAQVKLQVDYASDLDLVELVLLEVAAAHEGVLGTPASRVELTEFGESGILVVLHVWTKNIKTMPALLSDLNKAVFRAFRKHRIKIPVPQGEIRLHSEPAVPGTSGTPVRTDSEEPPAGQD